MPTSQEVKQLMGALLSDRRHARDLDVETLAERLAGRPLADVAFLMREAARLAARSGKDSLDQRSLEQGLEVVLSRTAPGTPRRPIGFLDRG
jgi:ATP-dependent Zn protease